MVHQRQRLALGFEPGGDLPAVHAQLDDLERHTALHRLALLRHPDLAEPALTDLLQQLVASQHLGGGFGRSREGTHDRKGVVRGRPRQEPRRAEMRLEQLVQRRAQAGILPAGVVEKGDALGRRRLLHRQIEEDLFEALMGFGHTGVAVQTAFTLQCVVSTA